jgi:esterase/lipase superfamily enzyme
MKSLRAVLRNVAWLLLLSLFAASSFFQWQGCRTPTSIVMERRIPYGIEYDASAEARLKSGEPFPALLRPVLEMSRQYADTLSQPVGIIGWRGDAPTCEIFFATNRDVIPATAGSGQERFGNQVLNELPYCGRAAVTIPFRSRGQDPQREVTAQATSAETPAVSLEEVRSIPWESFAAGVNSQLARSRQGDLLLFVHGFNVDFESALVRTAQLGVDIPFNGAVLAYCWPSQGGILSYPADEDINARSVQPFTEFLQRLIATVPSGTRISILVHSMGNRLVMQGIGKLPQVQAQKPIANLALCAPDVGVKDFKNWAPGVVAKCDRVALYASQSDSALISSKHLHNREQRAGDAFPPVCLPGIETIDVSGVDFDVALGHSYYGSNLNVLSDLYFLIKEHRPAAERGYLTRTSLTWGRGHYWQFHDAAPYIRYTWKFGETLSR